MNIRIAGVAIVGVVLLVAGCGTDSAATKAQTSTAAPKPAASDEDQIRDVLTKEAAAFSAWDFNKVAEFTCAQFREQAKSADSAIPPMSTFPAADAVIRQDESAYEPAMLEVVKHSRSVQLVLVDKIAVKGDTATADAMVTQRMGAQPPDAKTTPATLIREDGEWRDCTPPDQH